MTLAEIIQYETKCSNRCAEIKAAIFPHITLTTEDFIFPPRIRSMNGQWKVEWKTSMDVDVDGEFRNQVMQIMDASGLDYTEVEGLPYLPNITFIV